MAKKTPPTVAAAAGKVIALPAMPAHVEITGDWIASRDQLLAVTSAVTAITNRDDYDAAADSLKKLTKTSNQMEAFRKEFGEPFLEATRKIKSAADVAREPLESEKGRVQRLMAAYVDEQDRLARVEARRIAAEQQAAAEKRLAEENERREAAAMLGLDESESPAESPVIEQAPVPTVRAPVSSDVKRTKSVEFVITNADDVPPSMMTIDERKIREWIRVHKDRLITTLEEDPNSGSTFLMGIQFSLETKISSR